MVINKISLPLALHHCVLKLFKVHSLALRTRFPKFIGLSVGHSRIFLLRIRYRLGLCASSSLNVHGKAAKKKLSSQKTNTAAKLAVTLKVIGSRLSNLLLVDEIDHSLRVECDESIGIISSKHSVPEQSHSFYTPKYKNVATATIGGCHHRHI